jgi:hypothetical protein
MSAELGRFNKRRGLQEAPSLPCGPSKPCHGCKHDARCQSQSLACDALAVFVSVGASAARLACAPRQPSAAIRERIEAFKLKRKTAPPPFRRPAVDDEAEAD